MMISEFVYGMSIFAIIWAALLTVEHLRRRRKGVFLSTSYVCSVVSFYLLSHFVAVPLHQLSSICPLIYDPVVYQIEGMAGLVFPGMVELLSVLAIGSFDIHVVFNSIYEHLPFFVILAASSEICYGSWTLADNLFTRFMLGAAIAYALYAIIPAVGPMFYFMGVFPAHMPDPASVPASAVPFTQAGGAFRNGMPSMHAAWTILCFLALAHSPWWHRLLGAVYVAVTFISTIGWGEHYLLDWIVALPLVMLIRGLSGARFENALRREAVASGFLLLASWCMIFRFAPDSLNFKFFIEMTIAASIALPLRMEIHLMRSASLAGMETTRNDVADNRAYAVERSL